MHIKMISVIFRTSFFAYINDQCQYPAYKAPENCSFWRKVKFLLVLLLSSQLHYEHLYSGIEKKRVMDDLEMKLELETNSLL